MKNSKISLKPTKSADEKKENKIKTLLSDVNKEFHMLNPCQQAMFAIEQLTMWRQKYDEAKSKIPKENFANDVPKYGIISQYPDMDASE